MTKMRRKSSHGFTLIETIIAIVILAIAVPPLLLAVQSAHQDRVTPVQMSTARWLAVEKMEDVIADRNSAARGYDWVETSRYPEQASVPGFAGYGRTVEINETGPDLTSPGTGYKVVTVRVSWSDINGTPREYALTTVLAEY
ncbi:MAG: prepilin-type N-terminal cleavage/methylation domain-containing protein [Phycisphaerales bacterium]|nr:MAG: prepilin-type N-terminal cleavage/methylation domain-containing protein [Phycisphaerales bacterium]